LVSVIFVGAEVVAGAVVLVGVVDVGDVGTAKACPNGKKAENINANSAATIINFRAQNLWANILEFFAINITH
jgi:hypothetical protein